MLLKTLQWCHWRHWHDITLHLGFFTVYFLMLNGINPCTQSAISCFWYTEKRNSNNWLPFSYLTNFYFEFLMRSFVFHFHKKMKNEIQFIFRSSFSWRKWKKNYLKISRLTLWLFSQIWSTRYSSASSCQVPWDFPLCNGHADIKNPLFRKQLMYFNVYIASCYFHICFILIVNCNIKHTSRSRHLEVFS